MNIFRLIGGFLVVKSVSSSIWDYISINNILESNPPKSGTDVYVDITVTDFNVPVNVMQETEWIIDLRQVWFDKRLMDTSSDSDKDFNHVIANRHTMNGEMWLPDTHVANAKTVKSFDTPSRNSVCSIYRNGTVYWSFRMAVAVGCPMEHYKFPFNSYLCALKLQSYGITTDRVRLKWSSNFPPIHMKLPKNANVYELGEVKHYQRIEETNIGNFSLLEATFHLTNLYRMYLIQVYMPSGMLVVLSWLAFWIDRDATAARVSLGSLCVVSIVTQASGLLGILPYISGIRAIDIWEATCISMIFLAMLEFATMHFMCRMRTKHDDYVKICEEKQSDDNTVSETFVEKRYTELFDFDNG